MTYDNCHQHLADELQKLHLRIQGQVLKFRIRFSMPPYEAFKGLVISDEEIDDILDKQSTGWDKKPDENEADDPLAQMVELETRISRRVEESRAQDIYLPLYHLVNLFQLTPFERDCLIVCLAPELDLQYERLYAYLQNDVTKKRPTVNLALELLCNNFEEKIAARASFSPDSPLLGYHLLEVFDEILERPSPLLGRFLRLDDRMVNFLLGRNGIDTRLLPFVSWGDSGTQWEEVGIPETIQVRLRSLVKRHWIGSDETEADAGNGNGLVFSFEGPSGVGKRAAAEALCGEFGMPLLRVDVRRMLQSEIPFEKAVGLIIREAILHGAALYWDHFDVLRTEAYRTQPFCSHVIESFRRFSGLVFLGNCGNWEPLEAIHDKLFLRVAFATPSFETRKQLWEVWLNDADSLELDVGELANKFRFGPGQIRDAVTIAHQLACWRDPDAPHVTLDDLVAACRDRSNQELGNLAQKLQPRYTWEDIVLPDDAMTQLQELCDTVRHRGIVQDAWGFAGKLSLGRGLTALFTGPSGTGKTMAAEVIANALELDLYKIDLSNVVSKYIGETEKNLDRIFQAAEDSNAILFFDEADALFGKRSEVRDSHDRYANIEISYLLQKIEAYDGVAILASNMRQHLDEAFLRRLAFTILFPFPNEADRQRIWNTIWPAETPRAADLDLDFMAKQFKLSGGNIKNIALAAAYLAASDGGAVTMDHLRQATRREFQKMGKTLSAEEMGA